MTDLDTRQEHVADLRAFLRRGRFALDGAFMTDLDGTAVLEREGRIYLPPSVDRGLAHVRRLGRPVIANTLRFPRSVINVFSDEWHRSAGSDLPLVSLKGSQIGRVVRSASGETAFEEWGAAPLDAGEIAEVMTGVTGMVQDGVVDLLVFHYPRDWRQGELIWTPAASRINALARKYGSASRVFSGDVSHFHDQLLTEDISMIFLLIDLPEDRLMAYQHTQRASFFTHEGVDKRSGAHDIARHLGIDLDASIGAGDAPPDDFLAAMGFAIVVGDNDVSYRGRHGTARVAGIEELGDLLTVVGESLE